MADNNNDKPEEKKEKKNAAPKPVATKRRRKKGAAASVKIPIVFPISKCKLRLLKLDRIKDFLLMEQEFIQNQEIHRPREETNEVGWRPEEEAGGLQCFPHHLYRSKSPEATLISTRFSSRCLSFARTHSRS